jgi:myo-inositol-1(or 4)-monophosphatase
MHPITNIALTTARKASKVVLRAMENLGSAHRNIKERAELVTKIESDAYQEAAASINFSYPNHKIWENNTSYTQNDYIWYINAIDGIINYSHGLPHFAITIAVQHNKRIKHAIIYDPIRQEIFAATRGEGAYLNNRRIRVSACKTLNTAILSFSSLELQKFESVGQILLSGSCALDLAYVAASRMDGFYGSKLNIFDLAAGTLLVKEAGGLTTDFNGEEDYFSTGSIIASNPKLLKTLINILQTKKK